MAEISEPDAIKSLDDVLTRVEDVATRERVIRWAWSKFALPTSQLDAEPEPERRRRGAKRKTGKGLNKKSPTGKKSYSPVKDLVLTPKDKVSIEAFIEKLQLKKGPEGCVACVYYLQNELSIQQTSSNHVWTCFKHLHWSIPPDLDNYLAVISSRNGWLETKDFSDIKLTPRGKNLIETDIPNRIAGKK